MYFRKTAHWTQLIWNYYVRKWTKKEDLLRSKLNVSWKEWKQSALHFADKETPTWKEPARVRPNLFIETKCSVTEIHTHGWLHPNRPKPDRQKKSKRPLDRKNQKGKQTENLLNPSCFFSLKPYSKQLTHELDYIPHEIAWYLYFNV